ncbi:MAG: NADPH-dependent F420 reductase [Polyangiaceae bacterium]|nr:NADPH-dependent F420 reductase [Polyangiaceae bacterium]
MEIGIIGGTGREGRGLAIRWARAGHSVRIGSRDAERARAKAEELSALAGVTVAGGSNAWAIEGAPVALLSVPYAAHAETLRDLAPRLAGKVLIDITVPLVPPAVRRVHLPAGGAAALEAQALLGESVRVVATLHHVSSAHLGELDAHLEGDVLACSNDAAALELCLGLVTDLGVRGLDAGPLANAVALESLTPVLLHLNKRYGGGSGIRVTGIP